MTVLEGGVFERSLDGALINEIHVLIKETQGASLTYLLCEVIWGPGSRSSPDINSAKTLIVDFPGSRTVQNKYLLFKLPNLWYFLLQHPELRLLFLSVL